MVTTISNVRTAYTAGVLKQSFIAFEGLVEECKERGIVLRQRLINSRFGAAKFIFSCLLSICKMKINSRRSRQYISSIQDNSSLGL